MFQSSHERLSATRLRTACQSGYVNSHSSHLETYTQPAVFTVWLQIPPSLSGFHPYLSADESSIHLRKPALACVCGCMFVCAHWGACCASIFTASISDKPNESRENRYLPTLSCSVLSSLFSHSVFLLLVFFPPASPPLAVCLPKPTLPHSLRWVSASIS